jgi:UDP-2,3-diacylglucosamine hydrolase
LNNRNFRNLKLSGLTTSSHKKIFFLSDFHLGAPDATSSLQRERKICQFLEEIRQEASEIFLMGDLFDFWYEYKKVVPKGYIRLLGKLAELSDQGIALHLFIGNHDMWVKDYFAQELSMPVYFEPVTIERNGLRLHIGHGDGLGPGDHGYKRLKKIFRNPFCQWLFGILPPAIGIGLAEFFSQHSRARTGSSEEKFLGEDKEWLITYCQEYLQREQIDYFIFGHRHLPIHWPIQTQGAGAASRTAQYINLGDWIRYNTYAVIDGASVSLNAYQASETSIIRPL